MSRITAESAKATRKPKISIFPRRIKLRENVDHYLEVIGLTNSDDEMDEPRFQIVFEHDSGKPKKSFEFEDCAPIPALFRRCSIDLSSFLDEHGRPPLPTELTRSRLNDGKLTVDYYAGKGEFTITYELNVHHPSGGAYTYSTQVTMPENELELFVKGL